MDQSIRVRAYLAWDWNEISLRRDGDGDGDAFNPSSGRYGIKKIINLLKTQCRIFFHGLLQNYYNSFLSDKIAIFIYYYVWMKILYVLGSLCIHSFIGFLI